MKKYYILGIAIAIFVFIILIAILIDVFIVKRDKKLKKYVLENSEALQNLQSLNNKYQFNFFEWIDKYNHFYDNENYFNNISCKEYLIYLLDSDYYKNIFFKKTKLASENKNLYELYKNELANIELKDFKIAPKHYSLIKINKIQNSLFYKNIKPEPISEYKIGVILHLTNLYKNHIFQTKEEVFTYSEIVTIIKKLRQRDWNNLCIDLDIRKAINKVEHGQVSNKKRFEIYSRDNYCCKRCGAYNKNLEIDHIIPVSRGGKSTLDNLQTLCHDCNQQKGSSI
ncbi:HNH endonuclease [Metamycoplasma equirhinis]|uniref:HNH endonuclease n=1 Tax=Metamycoplasma equirhinis TaxID=92402 RepID=UPI003593795A